jgi:hypothetical protein
VAKLLAERDAAAGIASNKPMSTTDTSVFGSHRDATPRMSRTPR